MEYGAACIPCLMSLPTSALTLLNIRISYGCCLCVKSEKVNLRQICAKKRPAYGPRFRLCIRLPYISPKFDD